MQTVLYNFLLEVPRAALIWLALMLLAMLATAGLVARPSRDRAGDRMRVRAAAGRHAQLVAETQEASRYAEEVAVAAERATATAKRRRAEWLTAQEEAEAAWRAFDAADVALRRVGAAAALPVPRTPRTPAEYADRERYLHRAATAAFWREELSVVELGDVLAHRHGWDPRRHPVEQEVMLHRAVRARLLLRQQTAAERERAVWRAADIAAASARSLRDEAYAAAQRAGQTRHRLTATSRWARLAAGMAPQSDRTARLRTARAARAARAA
ncbi:hypothetical protein [Micromonospora polyrhachis]|uniref:AP2/ERF domain-containing protein n=1 Tax=Micromonospora polyrhachis TaxID=1282883 RepID=A0A7W7SLB2_9ACTN|nr:hypothetical protein [Micromonospora polyrhachis]MBB4956894.1 hypothetical protein [Micromonospora polyrhachis]